MKASNTANHDEPCCTAISWICRFAQRMRMRLTICLLVGFVTGCARMAAPKYITQAKGVSIFLSDGRRYVLSPDEATKLAQRFDGRLFTSGTLITPEQLQTKPPVLAVAYPYGTGETHIHVYADGTAGHLRTLRTYQIYPMARYCTEAIRLAGKHGVLESRTNVANQASDAIGASDVR